MRLVLGYVLGAIKSSSMANERHFM